MIKKTTMIHIQTQKLKNHGLTDLELYVDDTILLLFLGISLINGSLASRHVSGEKSVKILEYSSSSDSTPDDNKISDGKQMIRTTNGENMSKKFVRLYSYNEFELHVLNEFKKVELELDSVDSLSRTEVLRRENCCCN